jgi:cell wall-associated NlpC family hydrolase
VPAHLQPQRVNTVRGALRIPALLVLLTALFASLLVTAAGSADAATTGTRAVSEASRHSGAPYRYGAAGPRSFDCSGFTQYVFSRFGKRLPHNTNAQYAAVRHVAKTAKQPGDLIFIGSSGNFWHVGIYAGNGKFWHSPKPGDVVRLAPIFSSSYAVGRV